MAAMLSVSRRISASRSDSHTEPPSRLSLKHATANTPVMSIEIPPNTRHPDNGSPPTQDNCDDRDDDVDSTITLSSTTRIAGRTVAPFLARHIPEQYAPLGVQEETDAKSKGNPNTKYCYRHRPDSKCRRTADEPSMENLQRVGATDR
jgi:hypothetical protein